MLPVNLQNPTSKLGAFMHQARDLYSAKAFGKLERDEYRVLDLNNSCKPGGGACSPGGAGAGSAVA